MIRPPLVVYNWGDVEVFPSVEAVKEYVEPVDVNNGEYLVFDSEGRILELQASSRGEISLQPADSNSRFKPQVRFMLLKLMKHMRIDSRGMEKCVVEQLFRRLTSHQQ